MWTAVGGLGDASFPRFVAEGRAVVLTLASSSSQQSGASPVGGDEDDESLMDRTDASFMGRTDASFMRRTRVLPGPHASGRGLDRTDNVGSKKR